MGETLRIVGSLVIMAVAGVLFLLVMRRLYRQRVAVWDEVLVPLGGKAFPRYDFNAFIGGRVPLPSGETLYLEQWLGRSGGRQHGQIVAVVPMPTAGLGPFFIGADGWASAYARWALRLPTNDGLGRQAAAPLNQGRATAGAKRPPASWEPHLAALRVYVLFGRDGWVRVYVPGGVVRREELGQLRNVIATLSLLDGTSSTTETEATTSVRGGHA